MKRWLTLALLVAAVGALPASASASPYDPFLAVYTDPALLSHLTLAEVPVRATGAVTVSFAGGCPPPSVCAYRGTDVLDLAGGGNLQIDSVGHGRSVELLAAGDLTPAYPWSDVVRDVSGARAGECSDEQPTPLAPGVASGADTVLAVADLLAPTRCAGPLPQDLARALPRVVLTPWVLAHGQRRFDLRSRRTLTAQRLHRHRRVHARADPWPRPEARHGHGGGSTTGIRMSPNASPSGAPPEDHPQPARVGQPVDVRAA